ncbi:AraC family transcriptional regulator [Virgisporangium aliadipatigenens]|uniref:AraC family transcriptional regulator n=1 Tax=Virgisporangium aliadipatigenens TaxID=741659 RepID=A0A8J4DUZ1_9ACTN|nr:helix-turn-helix domain-containing protein [Virgisporangium aliadipatigenens]GIJ51805.1 AraC family transcriptional regulator [Virgisporangium aliadipatigenens]
MLANVAVLVLPEVAVFELGVLCEVFGYDRTADGLPGYDFAVCSPDGAPVRTQAGFALTPSHGLERLEQADLVAVPPYDTSVDPPEEVLEALRRAAARGAYVMSVCSGAYALGVAGLLDDRCCTTHWRHTDELASRHPAAKIDPNVLYVVDDNILTSAGTAASIDLCLHLVRQEHGSSVATALARRMVVPPHREGGQAQFIETPMPRTSEAPTLQPLLTVVLETLHEAHTVESLAARAHMAPRTFARRFRAETGATPHDWLIAQRVLLARRLLEDTDLGVDAIALRTGLGSAATLRHHFTRRMKTSPNSYRATFKGKAA